LGTSWLRASDSKEGHGEVPVPGDTDDYEWTGYIPFEQLPQALNPESGLIVTANARVVGPNYKPYLTTVGGALPTARIYDLLHDRMICALRICFTVFDAATCRHMRIAVRAIWPQ